MIYILDFNKWTRLYEQQSAKPVTNAQYEIDAVGNVKLVPLGDSKIAAAYLKKEGAGTSSGEPGSSQFNIYGNTGEFTFQKNSKGTTMMELEFRNTKEGPGVYERVYKPADATQPEYTMITSGLALTVEHTVRVIKRMAEMLNDGQSVTADNVIRLTKAIKQLRKEYQPEWDRNPLMKALLRNMVEIRNIGAQTLYTKYGMKEPIIADGIKKGLDAV
jgi:hypothetical protein